MKTKFTEFQSKLTEMLVDIFSKDDMWLISNSYKVWLDTSNYISQFILSECPPNKLNISDDIIMTDIGIASDNYISLLYNCRNLPYHKQSVVKYYDHVQNNMTNQPSDYKLYVEIIEGSFQKSLNILVELIKNIVKERKPND